MSDDEIIAVVQAHKEGKQIQFKNTRWPDWSDCHNNETGWNFYETEYRVAPEPRKPREFYLCNGREHKEWVVVSLAHDSHFCGGEKIKVHEVIE